MQREIYILVFGDNIMPDDIRGWLDINMPFSGLYNYSSHNPWQ